jgi:xanthine dehydrogenase molybdopterin-binding subunit B
MQVGISDEVTHARIRSIDLSRSAAAPGVVDALSGSDLLQLLPPVPLSGEKRPRT